MPVHDWTRVDAGLFHHFHQRWIGALCDALNLGGLPPDYFALAEQILGGPIPDVLALHETPRVPPEGNGSRGVALISAPPTTRYIQRAESGTYARMANQVTVRHSLGNVVAVIELVSPGNKDSRHAIRSFVRKTAALIERGVHVLVVDLFPPTARDPQGIHKAIWDEIKEEPFVLHPEKPLTVVSYEAGPVKTAYVEPIAVGDALPETALFLEPELHVKAPLEATYQTTWSVSPSQLRRLLELPAKGAT